MKVDKAALFTLGCECARAQDGEEEGKVLVSAAAQQKWRWGETDDSDLKILHPLMLSFGLLIHLGHTRRHLPHDMGRHLPHNIGLIGPGGFQVGIADDCYLRGAVIAVSQLAERGTPRFSDIHAHYLIRFCTWVELVLSSCVAMVRWLTAACPIVYDKGLVGSLPKT
eukprot:6214674-Pleurochrysis_carterae.AAC.7